MTPRPGLLRGSKIKNYKGSNALRVTWSPPPGFSNKKEETFLKYIRLSLDEKADDLASAAFDGLF